MADLLTFVAIVSVGIIVLVAVMTVVVVVALLLALLFKAARHSGLIDWLER